MRRRVTFTEAFVRKVAGGGRGASGSRPKDRLKDRLLMDAGCPGLGLRLRAGGGRRYVCLVGGRYRTIGDPALIPLEDARAACHRMRAEPDEAKPDCPSFTCFVDGDWRAQYLARQKPRSRTRCEVALRTQLIPAFGVRRLDAISRADCLAWFDRYSAAAPGGANRTLDVLRQIMGAAVRAGHIAHNPTKGIVKNRRIRPMRFLTPEEVTRLHRTLDRMEAERPGWRARLDIVRLLLLTGCRVGEITGLTWREVDGGADVGTAAQGGSGGPTGNGGMRLTLADGKTGSRTVWLGPVAARILARQRHKGIGKGASLYVFPRASDPSRPVAGVAWHWRRIRQRAGLMDVRLHDLRHTFASHAVRGGVPLPVVARLLGHRNVAMTLRYAHAGDAEVAAAAERVGEAVWGMLGEEL